MWWFVQRRAVSNEKNEKISVLQVIALSEGLTRTAAGQRTDYPHQ